MFVTNPRPRKALTKPLFDLRTHEVFFFFWRQIRKVIIELNMVV